MKGTTKFRFSMVGIALLFAAIYWAFFACVAQGATNQISLSVVVTNVSSNGHSITINGSTRTWTNAIYTPSSQIRITNSAGWTATNLFVQLSAYGVPGPVPVAWDTNTANAILLLAAPGASLSYSISGPWGYGVLATQALVSSYAVRVPASVESAARRTNIVSGLVEAISDTGVTNRVLTSAPAFGSFAWKTNGYTTNGVLDRPVMTNAVNRGAAFSSPGTNGTGSEQFGSGAIANQNNATAVGTMAKATNSGATIVGAYSRSTGDDAVVVGRGASAGINGVAIGNAVAGDSSISIGNGSECPHTNSAVIGTGVTSTRNDQIRIGGSQDVVIGGRLDVAGVLSNNAVHITGGSLTNVAIAASGVLATNLEAHNAKLTNAQVDASSVLATNLTAHNAKLTNATVNAAAVVVTNLTAFGGVLSNVSVSANSLAATALTANSGGLTNVNIESASLTATNPVLLSAKATNAALDRATSTNATFRGATVMGGALSFPRYAIATLGNPPNYAVAIGSNAFVTMTGANSAATTNWGFVGAPAVGAAGGGGDGQFVILRNATGYNVALGHDGGDPNPTNRIYSPTGADVVVSNGYAATLIYDVVLSRWVIMKPSF